jgi:hypothetical protein
MNKRPLWSEGKTHDEIVEIAKYAPNTVVSNLLEDIQCVREESKSPLPDFDVEAPEFDVIKVL